MKQAIKTGLEKWTPWVYLSLLAIMTIAVSVLLVFIVKQNNEISTQSDKIAKQNHRTAVLAQRMCQNLNQSRVNSNNTLRKPLKATTQAISNILKQSIPNARTATQRAALTDLASQFQKYSDKVSISKATPCTFTKP